MKRILLFLFLAGFAARAAAWDGVVEWAQKVPLGVPVPGVIARVEADVGASVAKGDLLLALEATPFEADLAQAQAATAQARLARDEAKRDLGQAEELYARTVLSTVELENAKLRFERAQAHVREAEAEVARARYRLTRSALRAPFDGFVLARNAEPGQSVAVELESPTLFVLVARGAYVARTPVPAGALAGVKPGRAATVGVAGREFQGEVHSVGLEPVVPGPEPRYEVRVVFDAGDTLLRAGEPAKVELR